MKRLLIFALIITAIEFSMVKSEEAKCPCNKPKPKPVEKPT